MPASDEPTDDDIAVKVDQTIRSSRTVKTPLKPWSDIRSSWPDTAERRAAYEQDCREEADLIVDGRFGMPTGLSPEQRLEWMKRCRDPLALERQLGGARPTDPETEAIVRALAVTEPPLFDCEPPAHDCGCNGPHCHQAAICGLCSVNLWDRPEPEDPSGHAETCPWRRAREWVARHRANAVVRDNPETMERLKDGDPMAIVDLLRAAGAKPRFAIAQEEAAEIYAREEDMLKVLYPLMQAGELQALEYVHAINVSRARRFGLYKAGDGPDGAH